MYNFIADIKMEFGLKTCYVKVEKRSKINRMTGLRMPTGKVVQKIEERGLSTGAFWIMDELKEKERRKLCWSRNEQSTTKPHLKLKRHN